MQNLRGLQADYSAVYKHALNQQNTPDKEFTFSSCKNLKDKIKLAIVSLKKQTSITGIFNEYLATLSFSPDPTVDKYYKEKLLTAICEENYATAVDTLESYELGPDNLIKPYILPSQKEIIRAMLGLEPRQLEGIAKCVKPTLLLIPPVPRAVMAMYLDHNHKYPEQENVFFQPDSHEQVWGPENTELKVSFVDGTPAMPLHRSIDEEKGIFEKAKEYQKLYGDGFNMKMISADEYLVLQMHSLRNYEKFMEGVPEKEKEQMHQLAIQEIVDDWGDADPLTQDTKTMTMLNIEHVAPGDIGVPTGTFRRSLLNKCYIFMQLTIGGLINNHYRSRPAVQVL